MQERYVAWSINNNAEVRVVSEEALEPFRLGLVGAGWTQARRER